MNEGRNVNVSAKITDSLEKEIREKAKEYETKEGSLVTLCVTLGFFVLVKFEERVKKNSLGSSSAKEVIFNMANDLDLNGLELTWGADCIKKAVQHLSVDAVLLNGLKSIKKDKERKEVYV